MKKLLSILLLSSLCLFSNFVRAQEQTNGDQTEETTVVEEETVEETE